MEIPNVTKTDVYEMGLWCWFCGLLEEDLDIYTPNGGILLEEISQQLVADRLGLGINDI